MKKVKSLIVLLVVTLLLTGCVKYNVNMEIRKDKSMNFEMIYAVNESLLEGKDVFDEKELKEIKDKGFKVEEYNKDNMKGFTLTKEIKNIDAVSSPDAKEYSLSAITEKGNQKIFKVKKGLFKNKYTANLKFSSSDSNLSNGNSSSDSQFRETEDDDDDDSDSDSDSSLDDYDYSSMANMDMSVNVKLPYKALSNNASSVENDGKDLKWNLSTSGTESINFEFELYNMTTIYLFIGLGVLLVVGIIVLIVVLVAKGSKKNKVATE
jgi:hypothetical protein